MNTKDRENITYVIKSLREYASDMSDIMDEVPANDPKFGVAQSAKIGFKIAYNMLISAMRYGDLEWQSHDDMSIPANAKFIKDGKLV